MTCELCPSPATVGTFCRRCFKGAVRGAAAYFLRFEVVGSEEARRARGKTLANRMDRKIKRALKRRLAERCSGPPSA